MKVVVVSENKWILKLYEVNVENAWKWKWKWRSSPGNDLPRRYGEFPLEFASTPICDIDPYYAGFFNITMLTLFNGILGFDLISLIASIPFHSKVSAVLLLTQFLFQTRRPSSSSARVERYLGSKLAGEGRSKEGWFLFHYFRFSAEKALYLLSPFHPIRR